MSKTKFKERLFFPQDGSTIFNPDKLEKVLLSPTKYYLDIPQLSEIIQSLISTKRNLRPIIPLLIILFKQQHTFLEYIETKKFKNKDFILSMFFDQHIFLFCELFQDCVYNDLVLFQAEIFYPELLNHGASNTSNFFLNNQYSMKPFSFSISQQTITRLHNFIHFLIEGQTKYPNNKSIEDTLISSIPFNYLRLPETKFSQIFANYILSKDSEFKEYFFHRILGLFNISIHIKEKGYILHPDRIKVAENQLKTLFRDPFFVSLAFKHNITELLSFSNTDEAISLYPEYFAL